MAGPKPGRESGYDGKSGKVRRQRNADNIAAAAREIDLERQNAEEFVPLTAQLEEIPAAQENEASWDQALPTPPAAEDVRPLAVDRDEPDVEAAKQTPAPQFKPEYDQERPKSIRALITGMLEEGKATKDIEAAIKLFYPNSAAASKATKHIAFYRSKRNGMIKAKEQQAAAQAHAARGLEVVTPATEVEEVREDEADA